MAFNISRYTHIYRGILRPDVAQTFPRHVFVREPNSINPLNYNLKEYYVKQ
jgi:hypothetical protein